MSNYKLYLPLFIIIFLFFSFCVKSNDKSYRDNKEEIKSCIELNNFRCDGSDIRYYEGKKNNNAFREFNLNFVHELTEQEIYEAMSHYKVFYKDNKLIKYESYVKPYIEYPKAIPGDSYSTFENRFEKPPSLPSEWTETSYHIFDDNSRLIEILVKNKYKSLSLSKKIKIEYLSNESAFYKSFSGEVFEEEGELVFIYKLFNGEKVLEDEGELIINNDNLIINYRSFVFYKNEWQL